MLYSTVSPVIRPYLHNQGAWPSHNLIRSLKFLAWLTLHVRSTFVNSEKYAKLAIARVIVDLAEFKLGLHPIDPLPRYSDRIPWSGTSL